MRRFTLLLAAAAFALAIPAQAKMPWLAKAKAAGIADAKCTTCHTAMGKKDLNDVGTFAKSTIKKAGDEPDFAAVAKHIKK
jgi:mono/diheme cytochrome c family protein